ncbi:DUF2795 domain-containing protein [Streptomyces sp. CA-210063]|uniref:DUF2795 domain-containing protein n=1 Tax=Streptomyces sp. CA-210063 TaxID=2801029 RepID=UPI00214D0E95|nr:DUF2795 domain-containing protein [Streptomyces sp. CA-210063]UUU29738.1 DUF2795 domain-containing protein [Streptomyces sp. CA-210063]
MAHATVDDVLGALRNVDFPAGRTQLLEAARSAGASGEVMSALRGIPPETCTSRDDIVRSVRTDPDSDLGHSQAQRGDQARQGGKPGLSQHLREVPKPPIEEELDR